MTACTERRLAAPNNGRTREGQKGMPKRHSMTACTERRLAAPNNGRTREGQNGMAKEAQP